MDEILGIAGLNNAGRSQHWVRRCAWMVIFLAGLAGTLHSTIILVQDMIAYPVDTTVTITTQNKVYFNNPSTDRMNIYVKNFRLIFHL